MCVSTYKFLNQTDTGFYLRQIRTHFHFQVDTAMDTDTVADTGMVVMAEVTDTAMVMAEATVTAMVMVVATVTVTVVSDS